MSQFAHKGDGGDSIEVPINWKVGDHIQSQHVTNIVVQHTDHEFIVSFFEVKPPIVLRNEDEDAQAKLQAIEQVEAECVARVVIAPGRMHDFLEVLVSNYNHFVEQHGAIGEMDG